MAKVSATYGGFLNAEKTKEAGLVGKKLTILAADSFKFDDGSSKIVIEFEGDGYKLALNVTNANTLAAAFGDESDEWAGEEVKLNVEKVQMGGKKVDGVRIVPLNVPEEISIKE